MGAGGPRFKTGRPGQNTSRVFYNLLRGLFTQKKLTYGIPPDKRSGFASRLVPKISPHAEPAKTRGGRSAIQRLSNGRKLNARHLASMGKIKGTLRISRLINLRKCKSAITHGAQAALHSVSRGVRIDEAGTQPVDPDCWWPGRLGGTKSRKDSVCQEEIRPGKNAKPT